MIYVNNQNVLPRDFTSSLLWWGEYDKEGRMPGTKDGAI